MDRHDANVRRHVRVHSLNYTGGLVGCREVEATLSSPSPLHPFGTPLASARVYPCFSRLFSLSLSLSLLLSYSFLT